MSFSSDVKEELAQIIANPRHCRIAELSAIIAMNGRYSADGLTIGSENPELIDKAAELIHRLLELDCLPTVSENEGRARLGKRIYELRFSSSEASQILATTKLSYRASSQCTKSAAEGTHIICKNTVDIGSQNDDNYTVNINPMIYRQTCCKRAYLRGAFLAGGSITDPEKDYHLEIVTDESSQAEAIVAVLSGFDIDAKIVARKKYLVVYIKDSEQIVDILNIMEAHVALMDLENIRILKDMRNSVNRRVNCEAANIGKTIEAAGRQIEDIRYLRDTVGFKSLSPELRATAELRLEYPESSLSELGSLHEPPVGRSGVNHRLKKLSELATQLREGKNI